MKTVNPLSQYEEFTDMKETTFIYGLVDPRTNDVRYVGKTDNPKKRLYDHVQYAKPVNHKGCWITGLKQIGLKPSLRVLEVVPNDCWQESEMWWISHLKSFGVKLTNSTAGGDGVLDLTPEAREKIGAARRGIPRTEEVKVKLSEKCRGWSHTPDAKAKISAAGMGRSYGPLSDEHKAKISKNRRGIPVSEEGKLQRSATMKGRVKSAEHRAKLAEAARADWAKRKARGLSEDN